MVHTAPDARWTSWPCQFFSVSCLVVLRETKAVTRRGRFHIAYEAQGQQTKPPQRAWQFATTTSSYLQAFFSVVEQNNRPQLASYFLPVALLTAVGTDLPQQHRQEEANVPRQQVQPARDMRAYQQILPRLQRAHIAGDGASERTYSTVLRLDQCT